MIDPDDPRTQSNRRSDLARRCLQLAFVLFVIGLVPTVLAAWGERRATASMGWRDPAESLEAATIAPDLALLSLAGVADHHVLALSLEKGELETTCAVLVFGVDLTDKQRMNHWLWLAFRYQETGQITRAAQAYRLAGSGAILSPDLPDMLRTETLLAVGLQLLALQDKPGARFYLSQAALISAHAPLFTAYHQRSLLERLVPAVVSADGKRADWAPLAKVVKSGMGRPGTVNAPGTVESAGSRAITSDRDATLIGMRVARQTAAAALLEAISATNNGTGSIELEPRRADSSSAEEKARETLRQTLFSEDRAVDQLLAHSEGMPEVGRDTQETAVRWLLLKRRIAEGGFGTGLMPEWESDRESINTALNAAWTGWLTHQAAPADAAFAGAFQGLATSTVRQAIMAAHWGLYPNAAMADLVLVAQAASGGGRLHLKTFESGTPPLVGWSE